MILFLARGSSCLCFVDTKTIKSAAYRPVGHIFQAAPGDGQREVGVARHCHIYADLDLPLLNTGMNIVNKLELGGSEFLLLHIVKFRYTVHCYK